MKLNHIYNENCLDTMAKMPDEFIDLTVTSPPYDNLRDYKGYSFDFESIAKELFRVTKKGGVVVWVVGDATIDGSETGTSFRQALFFKECGFNLHDTMIYSCKKPYPSNNRYDQHFEYMFVISKGIPNTFTAITKIKSEKSFGKKYISGVSGNRAKDGIVKPDDIAARIRKQKKQSDIYTKLSNIWEIPAGYMVSTTDNVWDHPATFPEDIPLKHIKSWSNEGDLVYDPFMGSGTTAKMAHLLQRKWIGSEISEEYVTLANKRLWQYINQKTIFDENNS